MSALKGHIYGQKIDHNTSNNNNIVLENENFKLFGNRSIRTYEQNNAFFNRPDITLMNKETKNTF